MIAGEQMLPENRAMEHIEILKNKIKEYENIELEPYDAGIFSDSGGGNVGWWQDYLRAELERAYEFYQSQLPKEDL